jgi:hypothetical protein
MVDEMSVDLDDEREDESTAERIAEMYGPPPTEEEIRRVYASGAAIRERALSKIAESSYGSRGSRRPTGHLAERAGGTPHPRYGARGQARQPLALPKVAVRRRPDHATPTRADQALAWFDDRAVWVGDQACS